MIMISMADDDDDVRPIVSLDGYELVLFLSQKIMTLGCHRRAVLHDGNFVPAASLMVMSMEDWSSRSMAYDTVGTGN